MSAPKWTASQLAAIEAGEGNFLVAAGAGSGKTAVLTERVFRLVKDHEEDPGQGAGLDSLLVLTFTDKAAAEMKDKIRKKILSDPTLRHLSGEVEGASIMTFDAFAHQLVSRYHYDIGVNEKPDIVDDSVFAVEKNRLLGELLDEYYERGDNPISGFAKLACVKNDGHVREAVLSLDSLGDRQSDKMGFYAHYDSRYFSDSYIDEAIAEFEKLLRDGLTALSEAGKAHYVNENQSDKETSFIDGILQNKGFDAFAKAFREAAPFPRKIPTKKSDSIDNDKATHTAIAKRYKEFLGYANAAGSRQEIKDRYLLTKPYVDAFVEVASELERRLSSRKKEAGMYGFADIATMARKIVSLPGPLSELRRKYRYVMIDEYQDTSDLQESFIDALSGGTNVFAVGDIKQSIYLFRNANPTLFSSKRERFERHDGGTLITLAENFRSRKEVLEDINAIFSPIMRKELGGIDYRNRQSLVYGNKAYGISGDEDHHLEIYSYEKPKEMPGAEAEARLIAEDILEKVRGGYEVLRTPRGKPACLGPATWGDFAILDITKGNFDVYRKVFLEAGIPLEADSTDDASSLDITMVFRRLVSLLAHLDEPGREASNEHGYLSVMRSFLYGRKDPDLYDDVTTKKYLKSPLFETIRAKKKESGNASLSELTEWIIDEFGFVDKLRTLTDVKDDYAELQGFAKLASSLDRFGLSLRDFDAYFDRLKDYEVKMPLESAVSSPSAVSLMSIHSSKGLEYKIVYVPGEGKRFNFGDFKGAYLSSEKRGLVIPLLDGGEPQNIFHVLLREEEIAAHTSEELRLYYVALTRAQEKLILLAPADRKEPIKGLESPSCLLDFLSLSRFGKRKEKEVVPLVKIAGQETSRNVSFPFRRVEEEPVASAHIRPSKSSLEPANEAALAYGTRLHSLMELTDFRSKDVSWIKDETERSLIEKVLGLPIFADLSHAEVYHEYAYYDPEENVRGSIDLLILYPNKAVIVDYKSRSIDDPAYARQVEAYASYVRKVTGLPVEKYLLSLGQARLRALQ
ncbi:MAG: UvrD-helicase domain-containing protein [Bacilli bacterium]|jgi:ATP-dependent helicase/nuclease subunit A|nr:UvrD-helicase domain-containing protein [Bacilli bacterium]